MTTRKRPTKPTRAQGRCSASLRRDSRWWASTAPLNALLNEPDDHSRFGPLKAQMLASLEQVVDMAEAQLNKLIDAQARQRRNGFRVLDGGRS